MRRGRLFQSSSQGYDAFISYSHAADGRLAPAVQRCLHRLAKPWYRPRALRVFRDEVSLSASPDLWATIEDALRQARYFILMASPEAARSEWVQREVAYWQQEREQGTFLIVLTAGTIAWDGAAHDFDWERTTALPLELRGWFRAEPLWVVLDWAHSETQLSLRHNRFRDIVATLAASVHGIAKDELDSEDVRQHRFVTRLRRAAVTGLTLLTLAAVVLGTVAVQQQQTAVAERERAVAQSRVALSRALVAEAETLADSDLRQATRLALTAFAASPTAQAKRGLMTMLDRNRHVGAFVRSGTQEVGRTVPTSARAVSEVALSPDGTLLAYGHAHEDKITLWDTRKQRVSGVLKPTRGEQILALHFAAGGGSLVSYDGRQILVWDPQKRKIRRSIDYNATDKNAPCFSLSPDGKTLAGIDGGTPTNEPSLTVWDLTTGATITNTSGGTITPDTSFTSDGRYLLAVDASTAEVLQDGSVQGRLARLDLRTGKWQPLPIDVSGASGFAMAARKPRLVVLHDNEIELWDYKTRRRLAAGKSPSSTPARSLAISADGNTVVTGDNAGHVYAFDSTLKTPELLTQHRTDVLDVAVSADGRLAASTSTDQAVMLTTPHRDHRRERLTGSLAGEELALPSIAVSPDGGTAAVSGPAGMALWDLPAGTVRSTLPRDAFSGVEPGVAWSPDSKRVAAAMGGVLSVWDVRTRKKIGSFYGEDPHAPQLDGTEQARFLPDGRSVLINQPTGPVAVDYERGTIRQRLRVTEAGSGFAASADGRVVVTAEKALSDGAVLGVWYWNGTTLRRATQLIDTAALRDLAVSPDGTAVAMTDYDGRVIWRSLRDGRRTILAAGLPESYASVAFSPDGRTIIQYKAEHELALWDTDSGLLLGAWQYPDAEWGESTLAASPDRTVLTIGRDGSVLRWDIDPKRWRKMLCGMALDELTDEERRRYLQGIDLKPMCRL